MNNNLVKTDTIWYKIKSFFRNIYTKNNCNNKYKLEKEEIINKKEEASFSNIIIRKEIDNKNKKKNLAHKLLTHEIEINDLNETEVDEMIEYFTKDIEEIDIELSRIKQHILLMRKQLYNNEQ